MAIRATRRHQLSKQQEGGNAERQKGISTSVFLLFCLTYLCEEREITNVPYHCLPFIGDVRQAVPALTPVSQTQTENAKQTGGLSENIQPKNISQEGCVNLSESCFFGCYDCIVLKLITNTACTGALPQVKQRQVSAQA